MQLKKSVAEWLVANGALSRRLKFGSDPVELNLLDSDCVENGHALYRLILIMSKKFGVALGRVPDLGCSEDEYCSPSIRQFNWSLLGELLEGAFQYRLEEDFRELIVSGDTEILGDFFADLQAHFENFAVDRQRADPTSPAAAYSYAYQPGTGDAGSPARFPAAEAAVAAGGSPPASRTKKRNQGNNKGGGRAAKAKRGGGRAEGHGQLARQSTLSRIVEAELLSPLGDDPDVPRRDIRSVPSLPSQWDADSHPDTTAPHTLRRSNSQEGSPTKGLGAVERPAAAVPRSRRALDDINVIAQKRKARLAFEDKSKRAEEEKRKRQRDALKAKMQREIEERKRAVEEDRKLRAEHRTSPLSAPTPETPAAADPVAGGGKAKAGAGGAAGSPKKPRGGKGHFSLQDRATNHMTVLMCQAIVDELVHAACDENVQRRLQEEERRRAQNKKRLLERKKEGKGLVQSAASGLPLDHDTLIDLKERGHQKASILIVWDVLQQLITSAVDGSGKAYLEKRMEARKKAKNMRHRDILLDVGKLKEQQQKAGVSAMDAHRKKLEEEKEERRKQEAEEQKKLDKARAQRQAAHKKALEEERQKQREKERERSDNLKAAAEEARKQEKLKRDKQKEAALKKKEEVKKFKEQQEFQKAAEAEEARKREAEERAAKQKQIDEYKKRQKEKLAKAKAERASGAVDPVSPASGNVADNEPMSPLKSPTANKSVAQKGKRNANGRTPVKGQGTTPTPKKAAQAEAAGADGDENDFPLPRFALSSNASSAGRGAGPGEQMLTGVEYEVLKNLHELRKDPNIGVKWVAERKKNYKGKRLVRVHNAPDGAVDPVATHLRSAEGAGVCDEATAFLESLGAQRKFGLRAFGGVKPGLVFAARHHAADLAHQYLGSHDGQHWESLERGTDGTTLPERLKLYGKVKKRCGQAVFIMTTPKAEGDDATTTAAPAHGVPPTVVLAEYICSDGDRLRLNRGAVFDPTFEEVGVGHARVEQRCPARDRVEIVDVVVAVFLAGSFAGKPHSSLIRTYMKSLRTLAPDIVAQATETVDVPPTPPGRAASKRGGGQTAKSAKGGGTPTSAAADDAVVAALDPDAGEGDHAEPSAEGVDANAADTPDAVPAGEGGPGAEAEAEAPAEAAPAVEEDEEEKAADAGPRPADVGDAPDGGEGEGDAAAGEDAADAHDGSEAAAGDDNGDGDEGHTPSASADGPAAAAGEGEAPQPEADAADAGKGAVDGAVEVAQTEEPADAGQTPANDEAAVAGADAGNETQKERADAGAAAADDTTGETGGGDPAEEATKGDEAREDDAQEAGEAVAPPTDAVAEEEKGEAAKEEEEKGETQAEGKEEEEEKEKKEEEEKEKKEEEEKEKKEEEEKEKEEEEKDKETQAEEEEKEEEKEETQQPQASGDTAADADGDAPAAEGAGDDDGGEEAVAVGGDADTHAPGDGGAAATEAPAEAEAEIPAAEGDGGAPEATQEGAPDTDANANAAATPDEAPPAAEEANAENEDEEAAA